MATISEKHNHTQLSRWGSNWQPSGHKLIICQMFTIITIEMYTHFNQAKIKLFQFSWRQWKIVENKVKLERRPSLCPVWTHWPTSITWLIFLAKTCQIHCSCYRYTCWLFITSPGLFIFSIYCRLHGFSNVSILLNTVWPQNTSAKHDFRFLFSAQRWQGNGGK